MSDDPTPEDEEFRRLTADLGDHQRGLYGKFKVEKVSDPTGRHAGCPYFVLDPKHDAHAEVALRAYAESCRDEFPALAADIDAWVGPVRAHGGPHLRAAHAITALRVLSRVARLGRLRDGAYPAVLVRNEERLVQQAAAAHLRSLGVEVSDD